MDDSKSWLSILLVAYTNWNITLTTKQGSRVGRLVQTGFAAFGKGVPPWWNPTTFPNYLTKWYTSHLIMVSSKIGRSRAIQRVILPFFVVCVRFQFGHTTKSRSFSQLLLASTNSNALLEWGSEKAFSECLGVNNVFTSAALVQLWLLIIMRWQVYHLARLFRLHHKGANEWAAPLELKQRNRSGLVN